MQETKRASSYLSALVERQQIGSRSLLRTAGGPTMRSRVLRAATFFLSLQLSAATSAHAQGPEPPTPPKARPPVSSIAHNVITWFHHVTGTGAHRHRIVSSPPLPRPRPAQFAQRRRRNYRLQRLSRIRRRRLSRMRRNLRPPPLRRIRCPRPPPLQLSQTRRRRLG